MKSCQRLRSVAERTVGKTEVTVNEIEGLWAEDRVVAAQCRRRLVAVNSFYKDLRGNLMDPERN